MVKNISKNLNSKYSQKLLDPAKKSATDACTTASTTAYQNIAVATDDLIGKKIVNKVAEVSKNSQQNNSETTINEHDKEIPKKDTYLQKKNSKLLMI